MAPHVALLTPEILHEIFAHLVFKPSVPWNPPGPPEDRLALANAALSCRRFKEPALDALWSRLENITHAFKLLPAFRRLGGCFVLDGVVTHEDWARFDSYAKRVRCLIFVDHGIIHPSVYIRVAQLKPSPLLPNLQSIASSPGGSGILTVLSPTLVDVRIMADESAKFFPEICTCLQVLSVSAPRLRVLSVQAVLARESLCMFSRMSQLEDLFLIGKGNWDPSFLTSLSSLQYLHTLKFEIDDSVATYTPSRGRTPPPSFFSSLRILEVFGQPWQTTASLSIFPAHPLRHLVLSTPHQRASPELGIWALAAQDIASKFRSLQHLELLCTVWDGALTPPALPDFAILEPLLELKGLELVRLEFPCLFFSDSEFEKTAAAWPNLRSLQLSGSSGIPNATIASLQSFAVHCPSLQSLSVAFDARKVPAPGAASAAAPVSFSKLESFAVQDSPIDTILSIGRHLDRLFPSLHTIEASAHQDTWADVKSLVDTLQLARMDQRARDMVTRRV
ncbi:hypothetical protein DXG01_002477 [Tephrocybe rancida]|nr:hypothetical protein DXG01_002477 [Tephrocybe rancida]